LILRKPRAGDAVENARWIAPRPGSRLGDASDLDGTEQLTKREVLVLDATGSVAGCLAATMGGERMIFRPARSVEQARRLAQAHRLDAAIAVLDESSSLTVDEVEALTATPSAADWIAIVAAQRLASNAFQDFVLRCFHDHHTLPIDAHRLETALGHACGRADLRRAQRTRGNGEPEASRRFGICGDSPAMQGLFHRLAKVVDSDAPVLIGGETGTGKELVAHAIHRLSRRGGGPMVAVNCGAIPPTLIQSELFGHEKSAFTGATQRKIGRIEAASGGVLFLDEIGDLPMDMQASLLRVLQERTISRVGSTQSIPVDFRVIAATHVDLEAAVRRGTFREDLYFRLAVLRLVVPPLRERGDDVVRLADLFLQRFAAQHTGSRARGYAPDARRALLAHDWPGNVRELINRVQGAVVMGEQRLVTAADLGLSAPGASRASLTLDDARARFERELLANSLRANGNKVSPTARQLGVSRVTLYRLIHKLNLRAEH
jgi:DNA-binding NtrC family response regulator